MATKKTAKKKGSGVKKIDGLTPDIQQEKIDALKKLVPEAFSDGKIDAKKLETLLGKGTVAEDERYRLDWSGKSEVFDEIAKRTSCTLTLDEKRSSKDWEKSSNVFIEGENMEVLRTLQKAYHGKVKMIYIDPPYNTGNDFVYNDNFSETEEEYCDDVCNIDENGHLKKAYKLNSKDSGRFHSNWLSMMYPRLYLARNLLRDDGVIFISIDDNELSNLKTMMDEIYGESNFIGQFIVNSSPSAIDYGHIAKMHDYVLFYAKDITETTTFHLTEKDKIFKYEDAVGPFNLYPLYNGNVAFNPTTRPNLYYPFYLNPKKKTGDEFYEIGLQNKKGWVEVYPVISKKDNIQRVWRWGKAKAQSELNIEIVGNTTESGEYRIVQKTRHTGKVIRSILADTEISSRRGTSELENLFGRKIFSFPKPTELIRRFINVATANDDIVLDFFAGSAPTAHAVMNQNIEDGGSRQYICAQIPEKTDKETEAYKSGYKIISDIAIDRIKKASKKIRKEHPDFKGDLGMRVYKETDSHFPQWHAQAFESDEALKQAMVDYSKEEIVGSERDRATEVLLKLGYPLTTELTEKVGCFFVEDDIALVLDSKFKVKDLQKVLDESPKTIVVLEKLFKKDEEKINFGLRCKEAGVILQTV